MISKKKIISDFENGLISLGDIVDFVRADAIEDCIKTLAESEDTILSDRQYYTLIELKEQKKEEMGLLEEHHKICKTCWSGQDKVVGRRCSGCINHNEYEPI